MFLILDNIRSVYNVGSIFRTADGAGVEKIYLCGYTPVPDTQKRIGTGQVPPMMAKTALGAEKTMQWEKCAQTWRLLRRLRAQGIQILALEQYKYSRDLFCYKPKKPFALIIGNEKTGLSKTLLNYVDDVLEIPMHGKKESLNVAVATGIALYQLIRHP